MGIFKEMKRKKKEHTIKLCPKCKRPKLQRTTYGSFTNTEYYKCLNCDYEGPLYLEISPGEEEKTNEILENLKKHYPEDLESE